MAVVIIPSFFNKFVTVISLTEIAGFNNLALLLILLEHLVKETHFISENTIYYNSIRLTLEYTNGKKLKLTTVP